MTKDFKQQLADLESGLNSILKTINNPKNRIQHVKAIENKHIQDARIDFFKRGYNLRERELREQGKLDNPTENLEKFQKLEEQKKLFEEIGCGETIGAFRYCGEVSFVNKIILCKDCRKEIGEKIEKAKKKKWEAEREHCDGCDESGYCSTCKPEFDKLNEIINMRDILE